MTHMPLDALLSPSNRAMMYAQWRLSGHLGYEECPNRAESSISERCEVCKDLGGNIQDPGYKLFTFCSVNGIHGEQFQHTLVSSILQKSV